MFLGRVKTPPEFLRVNIFTKNLKDKKSGHGVARMELATDLRRVVLAAWERSLAFQPEIF